MWYMKVLVLQDKKQAMLGFVEVISFVIEKLHNSTGTIQNIFKR